MRHLNKNSWLEYFNYIIITSIVLFLIFLYDFSSFYISHLFNYIDEIIVAGLFFAALIRIFYEGYIRFVKVEVIIALMVIIILFVGGLSSIINRNQSLIAIFSDFFIFIKPFVAYYSGRIVFREFDLAKYYPRIKKLLLTIIFVIGLSVFVDFMFDYFPTPEIRFGLPAVQLFFGHPSRYAFALSLSFILLYPSLLSKNNAVLIIVLLIGAFSLRYKYFGFMIIAMSSIYFVNTKKNIVLKKYLISAAILFGVLLFIGYDQLLFHYSSEALNQGHGRAALSFTSINIATDNFPFGSGFASFASYYSGVYYSPLYYDYGISNIYGLSEAYTGYIADSFWPMIVAQFGYVGLTIYVVILLLYFKLFIDLYNSEIDNLRKKICFSGILILLLLCIDSTSDSIITQNRGMASFFLLSLFVNSSLTHRLLRKP